MEVSGKTEGREGLGTGIRGSTWEKGLSFSPGCSSSCEVCVRPLSFATRTRSSALLAGLGPPGKPTAPLQHLCPAWPRAGPTVSKLNPLWPSGPSRPSAALNPPAQRRCPPSALFVFLAHPCIPTFLGCWACPGVSSSYLPALPNPPTCRSFPPASSDTHVCGAAFMMWVPPGTCDLAALGPQPSLSRPHFLPGVGGGTTVLVPAVDVGVTVSSESSAPVGPSPTCS